MINILLPAALAFTLLMAFYWFALRRVLLDQVRYRIFALRDQLRRMAMSGEINPQGFAYSHAEKTLCNLIRMAPELNIYRFGQFMVWRNQFGTSSRDARFAEIAPEEIRRIRRKAVEALFWVLWINSPVGGLLLATGVGFCAIAAAANSRRKVWLARKRLRLEQRGAEFLEQDLAGGPALATA